MCIPGPARGAGERSGLLWMSEIRLEGIPRYRLIPFKSLPFKPSQELGGCLNEVKAGGFSDGLTPRLCKIPIHNCAPSGAHLPEPRITNHEISEMAKSGRVVVRLTHEYRIWLSPSYLTNDSNNPPVQNPQKNRRCLSSATFPQSEIRNPQSENRNCLNP